MRRLLIGIAVLAGPALVAAGPLDEGVAALEAGRYEEALHLLRPLAEAGDAEAQLNLAALYDIGGGVPKDRAQAAAWYRRAAELGHAQAAVNLAVMYEAGSGLPQDLTQAARWFRAAAERGHVRAQYYYAQMCEDGRGTPQDYAEAARWYRAAADQGELRAQFNLGVLYRKGLGVPRDDVQAYLWYDLAASREFRFARRWRDAVARNLSPAQKSEAQRLVQEWWATHEGPR
jgi:TPR repeat protein